MLNFETEDDLIQMLDELREEYLLTNTIVDREIGIVLARHSPIINSRLVALNRRVAKLSGNLATITSDHYFDINTDERYYKFYLVYHGKV
jgi:hypothetical protein